MQTNQPVKYYLSLITTLFLSANAFCQVTGTYSYNDNYLCSSQIHLFPNRRYYIEGGCEADNYFAMGTWQQKLDTIQFHELDSTFNIINKVVKYNTGNPKLIVKVFDVHGNNVTGKYIIGQHLRNDNTYTMDRDSSRTFCVDSRKGDGDIVITSLANTFGKHTRITIDTADTYEIYLNNLEGWTYPRRGIWSEFGNFDMTITKEGLRTVKLEPDRDFNLVKKVYTKEPTTETQF